MQLYNNELYHYGKRGMKWGHHKVTNNKTSSTAETIGKAGREVIRGVNYKMTEKKEGRDSARKEMIKDDLKDKHIKSGSDFVSKFLKELNYQYTEATKGADAADKERIRDRLNR